MISEARIEAIPKRGFKYVGRVMRDVMQFCENGWNAAEVSIEKYANVGSAYVSYKKAINSLNVAVFPTIRRGKLYLIRSDNSGSEGE